MSSRTQKRRRRSRRGGRKRSHPTPARIGALTSKLIDPFASSSSQLLQNLFVFSRWGETELTKPDSGEKEKPKLILGFVNIGLIFLLEENLFKFGNLGYKLSAGNRIIVLED